METAPQNTESPPVRNNARGIAFMLVSSAAIIAMHAGIRHVSNQGLHAFEIAFFRNAFGVVVMLPLFLRYGTALLKVNRPGLMGFRALLNVAAMLCYFYAITIAPFADISALSFTAPIFATAMAALLLREQVGPRRWLAIFIGFAGAMVIIRPGFAQIDLGLVLTLVSSLVWGFVIILIKILTRTDSSVAITLFMGLLMTPLALVPALFVWEWPSLDQYFWLFVVGLLGTIGQFTFTEALKYAETAVVMPFDFTKLILAAGIGWIFFSETPTVFTWGGGFIIFAAATYIAIRESNTNHKP